jgi:hypothetical protein
MGPMAAAIVGRHHELLAIDRLLSRAAEGRGGLLVLVGPPGSGRTALADRACDAAVDAGLVVHRADGTGQGDAVWAQLLRDAGASDDTVAQWSSADGVDRSADATPWMATLGQHLLVVDELDAGGRAAHPLLGALAGRRSTAGPALLITSSAPLGLGDELLLRPLTRAELALLCPGFDGAELDAIALASSGWPGPAQDAAAELSVSRPSDPVVHLALQARSAAGFLAVDEDLVTLVRVALDRPTDPATRARLLSRLARELLGDATAAGERRRLTDEAVRLARVAADDGAVAEALDARLHAVWDPAHAETRRDAAAEIVELAVAAGDRALERRGLFWSFVAHMELAQVAEAEAALARYARSCASAGDRAGLVMVTARHAMLAALRGRFDDADRLITVVSEDGHRAGIADTDALVASLVATVAIERGDPEQLPQPDLLFDLPRLLPGQHYEASVAFTLAMLNRRGAAEAELDRALGDVLRSAGPRSLRAMVELAVVTVVVERADAAALLFERMSPHRGRLVLGGGAAVVLGPMARWLGLLATFLARDEAVELLEEAVAVDERIGALPGLANSLALLAAAEDRGLAGRSHEDGRRHRARADEIGAAVGLASTLADRLFRATDEWRLIAVERGWRLEAGTERADLPDGPGARHLRTLVANPRREIAALDLAAGGAGLAVPAGDALLDDEARADYRRRLHALEDELDAADRVGDPAAAARAMTERAALLTELRRAAGLGGRPRATSAEAERARVNVTRALRTVIARIALSAPVAGAHLQASIRTGGACRYEPAAGGPRRWRV